MFMVQSLPAQRLANIGGLAELVAIAQDSLIVQPLLSPAGFCVSRPAKQGEPAMAIVMHDLAGANPALRFSPYCWRTRMALAHKGLAVETIPWRFTDKAALAFSGQGRVPVIRDGDEVVSDSWAIAEYLDAKYPDRPSLFGGAKGPAHARFVNAWADSVMMGGIARLILRDLLDVVAPQDQTYFRQSREARFGMTLEAVQSGRETRVAEFRAALLPVRLVLGKQNWLGGEAPSYADYIVFGSLHWPRCVSRFELLERDDPISVWRERLLDLFDGLARRAPRVA
jgi:glutathione S-transferase